ncbi:MAG: spore germination protein, partial [Methylocystaceae bacterium]
PVQDWLAQVIGVLETSSRHAIGDVMQAILNGQVVVLSDNSPEAMILTLRTPMGRSIEEPSTERTIRGPREGFVETLPHNLSMIRHHLRDPNLVVENYTIGRRSQSRVAFIYIKDIARPEIVSEARRRLTSMDIDGILSSGYVEEWIEDSHYSLFPQMTETERPDRVAANLLEGRFAILVDGTPSAIVAPVVFSQYFQSTEDYYERWIPGSAIRFLRLFAFFIATSLTASYIALVSINVEMIPFGMLAFIAESRRAVPFPPFAEVLLVEFILEFLREAGLRIPQPVGQTVGVVGGIVLGDALIRANLVSPLLIILAVTSVLASFTIPNYTAALNLRLIRFPLIFMATFFGGVGIVGAWIIILTNLARTSSFGVPLLSPLSHPGEVGDLILRLPREYQTKRPDSIPHQDDTRFSVNSWRKRPK